MAKHLVEVKGGLTHQWDAGYVFCAMISALDHYPTHDEVHYERIKGGDGKITVGNICNIQCSDEAWDKFVHLINIRYHGHTDKVAILQ